jgi:hypothetical protein
MAEVKKDFIDKAFLVKSDGPKVVAYSPYQFVNWLPRLFPALHRAKKGEKSDFLLLSR